MPDSTRCPWQPCKTPITTAHEHVYPPPEGGQRQCHCGSRRWIIALGGMIPAQVMCERSRHPSRINTMYERGRAAGRRTVDDPTAPAPF